MGEGMSIWDNAAAFERAKDLSLTRTASQIAETLSHEFGVRVSRSAVIGKFYRMRFPLGNGACREQDPDALAERRKRKREQDRMRLRRRPPVSELLSRVQEAVAPPENGKTIEELGEKDCRWVTHVPKSAGKPYLFCGGEKVEGVSYCAYHARIAFNSAASTASRKKWEITKATHWPDAPKGDRETVFKIGRQTKWV